MVMNTAYLSMNTSAQSNINSPFIVSGLVGFSNTSSAGTMWVNDLVVRGSYTTAGASVFGSTVSVTGATSLGVLTVTSTETVGGLLTATGGVLIGPGSFLDAQSNQTHGAIKSFFTTASASSVLLADGAFGIFNVSTTSCTLGFRSGVTTYGFRADTASVL